MTTRRAFLKTTALGAAAMPFLSTRCVKEQVPSPNIIFLLTDDQRWDKMGCAGDSIIQTPNMDALAAEGVRFANAFVTTSICMCSRASVFTGQYVRRHGVNSFFTDLSPDQLKIAYFTRLHEAGYRTGFLGKYGVGFEYPIDAFDYWKGVPPKSVVAQPSYFIRDEDGKEIHLTRYLEKYSLEFLKSCKPDQPFCLSVSFKAPHVQDEDPRQFLYDPQYKDLYEDIEIPVPETATREALDRLPDFLKDDKTIPRKRHKMRFETPELFQEMVKGHHRLVTGADVAIGHIRAELKASGLDKNTVIVFMGDNGFFFGEHGFAGKWYGYEESIRVPLIVYDPRLPQSLRGKVREEMALNIDVAPTLLGLAGLSVPAQIQGESLLPLVHGDAIPWREDFFYEHLFVAEAPEDQPEKSKIPRSIGVVGKRYKYLRYIDQKPVYEQLFDLEKDPTEVTNFAEDPNYHEILEKMRKRCDELAKSNE
jgi:arylsulfatase A-like enzyme